MAAEEGSPAFDFKVRTVTVGVELDALEAAAAAVVAAAASAKAVASGLARSGYEVQTVRVTTNSFEEWVGGGVVWPAPGAATSRPSEGELDAARTAAVGGIAAVLGALEASGHGDILLNAGPARSELAMRVVPDIVSSSPLVTCSAHVPCDASLMVPDLDACRACADAIIAIAAGTPGGEGNFQFAATFNCGPGVPYFPAGYHAGDSSFAIGLENPGLVMRAFKGSDGLADASRRLTAIINDEAGTLAAECERLAAEVGVPFAGVDASIAPSPHAPSLVDAYEALGLGRFGDSGSLAVSALITQALRNTSIKRVGYSGLMLPPLEDAGLAKRDADGTYRISDLLSYSAVCGLGLDTVPIPGDVSPEVITSLMADIAALAFRLNKPLSCRLFPVPGKAAGEMTSFANPHMCDAPVFDLE